MRSINDARLRILEHVSEFLMEFTNTDEMSQPEIEELLTEADEQAGMLIDSMGVEVTGLDGDTIQLTMKLSDVGKFIDDYLDSKFVEDTTP